MCLQEEEEEVCQGPACERENGEDAVYGGKPLFLPHNLCIQEVRSIGAQADFAHLDVPPGCACILFC